MIRFSQLANSFTQQGLITLSHWISTLHGEFTGVFTSEYISCYVSKRYTNPMKAV